MITPLVVLAVLRTTLFAKFSITLHVQEDWYNHAVSFGMFLFGFLIARSTPIWADRARPLDGAGARRGGLRRLCRVRHGLWRPARAAGSQASGDAPAQRRPAMGREPGRAGLRLSPPARAGAARRSISNRGLFTFYIVHQPALLLIITLLKKAELSAGLEVSMVIGLTLATCVLAYELARRSGWLAPFLGQAQDRPAPRLYRLRACDGFGPRLEQERPRPQAGRGPLDARDCRVRTKPAHVRPGRGGPAVRR